MLWYGSSNINKFCILSNKNQKKKLNLKMKKSQIFLNLRFNLNKIVTLFRLPPSWDVVVWKNKEISLYTEPASLYLYTTAYFLHLPVPFYIKKLLYDKNTKVFTFVFNHKNVKYGLFWKEFNNVLFSLSSYFFKKLKFKGKGYYIFKNSRNTVALQFGYSHKIYVYSYFIFIKFISKTVVLLFGINTFDLTAQAFKLFYTRSYNIFTGKGIRFAKQIIYKKVGKVSSYR